MIKLNQLIQENLNIQQNLDIQKNRKTKTLKKKKNTATIKIWIQGNQAIPITKNP